MTNRAYSVYNVGDLMPISATGKDGKLSRVTVELKWTQLDPMTALMIYQKCPPVFGIISSRANRVSSIEWHIVPIRKEEDKIVGELKSFKELFLESDGSTPYELGRKISLFAKMRYYLPDLKSDMSNFQPALQRWRKKIKSKIFDECSEIEDFFQYPAPGVMWNDYSKQIVQDLHVHGRLAIFKKLQEGKVGNIYILPGGSVVPLKGEHVGSLHGYVQLMDSQYHPQLFFRDEIAFAEYMPNSATSYGMNPLDALINLVSENLLFNELMANQADGSETPKKLIVFGDKDPGYDTEITLDQPLDKDEQRRIENKLNRKKRDGGVATLTGYGTPLLVDLSRADTMASQIARQEQIDRYVAMVFNASNIEINQTGGDGTSGRSTSEVQERNDNSKGVRPILKIIEELFSHEIIPFRFGYGYKMEFEESISDEQKIDLNKKKKDSGIYSVNEIRASDNLDPINDPQFDVPAGATPDQQSQQLLADIKGSLR